ncbi:substrate-binding domain-containing protein [Paenibacillus sanguinis]|uniref:substrate-binding domain-containing protein n=1 Tax=Paenibacillus sanguinis TaxID=225906 RepID=UPI000370C518|nr:substrate-binding domain-containing protein [Paenibacillus sanguinis]
MKYKKFALLDSDTAHKSVTPNKNIAMITRLMPNKVHFASMLLTTFEKELSQHGYSLMIHILQDNDIRSLALPPTLDPQKIDAIICVELFDSEYSKMLCSLGKPVLFTDTFYEESHHDLSADILMMENRYSISKMVQGMIKRGVSRIGFVGDRYHCLSFYERWEGFCHALASSGLPVDESICIIDNDALYWENEWLANKIKDLSQLPEAFVCANDYLAVQLITTLKKMNIEIPGNVMVCGFDNAPEASIIDPPLTTVHIPCTEIGLLAAQKLLARIQNPKLPYEISYIRTQIIFRESTEKKLPGGRAKSYDDTGT